MATKSLSYNERLALQAGAVLNVLVQGASEAGFQVELIPAATSSNTGPFKVPNRRSVPHAPSRSVAPNGMSRAPIAGANSAQQRAISARSSAFLDASFPSRRNVADSQTNLQPSGNEGSFARSRFDGSRMVHPSSLISDSAAGGMIDSASSKKRSKTVEPPPGQLLNTLKTGMKLEGTVVSSTPYAAFVGTGTYRMAKGGRYAPVNAFLHKDDLDEVTAQAAKRWRQEQQRQQGSRQSGARLDLTLLQKGTPLTVYVKEVYKNSG